jgi:hypothetical protein
MTDCDNPTNGISPNVTPCCDEMGRAVEYGFVVDGGYGALSLPARNLTAINPDASAGNVLTGETYDPAEFSLTLVLAFCPWCSGYLGGLDDDDDWMAEPPGRPVEDTKPL